MDIIIARLDFLCYIDNILILNDIMEQHHIYLQIMFEMLKVHSL